MPLRQTLTAFTSATFKILRRYSEILMRFYYDHEDLSPMLPRYLCDDGASTTLFLRVYTDSCWPRSRYACFEHVQNKRGESAELSDHGDSTAIILRFLKTPLRFSCDVSRSVTFSATLRL
ncbi:hypothetical protein DPMN_126005 [Dreissena polymorpha]|uniref:Uncharacterized protein n=1 Tax=Dreissena polymorpha TaxID=45954 RepID=A0A9D4GYR7_DREPO|nr:hypothetical protein DPMN_126005 [Dreissena polymorpha]